MTQQQQTQHGSQGPIDQQTGIGAGTQQPTGGIGGQATGGGQFGQTGGMGGQQMGAQPTGQQAGGIGGGQVGTQQQMGQQAGGMGITLEEAMTNEMRVALEDFVESAKVCEWCAEQCIDLGPEMNECIRLCRDVADLATLNVELLSRDSAFGPEAAQVFASAAEACAQECAQHGHKHCQECAEVLTRAVRSTREMLSSFGGGQVQQPGGGIGTTTGGQFQQPGGQPGMAAGGQIGAQGGQAGIGAGGQSQQQGGQFGGETGGMGGQQMGAQPTGGQSGTGTGGQF